MKAIYYIFISLCCSCCAWTELKTINNAAYSIGMVDSYSPGSSAFVIFRNAVKGNVKITSYGNGLHHWNVPSGVHNGDKYMVQYDSLDASVARMLFAYPVHDSTDYKNDIALFKKTQPGYPSP